MKFFFIAIQKNQIWSRFIRAVIAEIADGNATKIAYALLELSVEHRYIVEIMSKFMPRRLTRCLTERVKGVLASAERPHLRCSLSFLAVWFWNGGNNHVLFDIIKATARISIGGVSWFDRIHRKSAINWICMLFQSWLIGLTRFCKFRKSNKLVKHAKAT